MSQNFNGPVTVDGNEVATSATIERLIPDIIANTTGSGNAVTAISVDDSNKHKLNITKGSTFLTSHQSLADLGITATAAELNVLDGITATTTELNYTDGVTSNIQTQLNGKLGTSAKAADSDKLDGNDSSYFATASALANKADKASVTAGTNCKITYNAQGIVTAGTSLSASDIPDLDTAKIASGTFADARIASASTWNAKQNALPTTTTAGKVLKSTSTAGTIEWGDVDIDISGKMDKSNPTGTGSLSINRKAGTTIGSNSVAEGYECTASGTYSHAEGEGTIAIGVCSHAEGKGASYSGLSIRSISTDGTKIYSYDLIGECPGRILYHIENGVCVYYTATAITGRSLATVTITPAVSEAYRNTENWGDLAGVAFGNYSHAEGWFTTASGNYSHAEGYNTVALGNYQHVFGKYNAIDSDKVEIVGKGSTGNPSNARTLDWSGNEWLSGKLEAIDGINYKNASGTSFTNGLKFVKCTQAEYDALVSAGTVDSNTFYIIVG